LEVSLLPDSAFPTNHPQLNSNTPAPAGAPVPASPAARSTAGTQRNPLGVSDLGTLVLPNIIQATTAAVIKANHDLNTPTKEKAAAKDLEIVKVERSILFARNGGTATVGLPSLLILATLGPKFLAVLNGSAKNRVTHFCQHFKSFLNHHIDDSSEFTTDASNTLQPSEFYNALLSAISAFHVLGEALTDNISSVNSLIPVVRPII
jgi:hypothetical protein